MLVSISMSLMRGYDTNQTEKTPASIDEKRGGGGLTDFPVSFPMMLDRTDLLLSSNVASSSNIDCRCCTVVCDQVGKASPAAATAESTSSNEANGTSHNVSPLRGASTGFEDSPSRHSLEMMLKKERSAILLSSFKVKNMKCQNYV